MQITEEDVSRAKTKGQRYVDEWLDEIETPMDYEWIAECINEGWFLVCPRCRFLHLPQIAWWLGNGEDDVPVDGCDVCAHVAAMEPYEMDMSFASPEDEAPEGWQQAADLRRGRTARAWLLFQLWWRGRKDGQAWAATMAKGAWMDARDEAAGKTPYKTPPLSL